MKFGFGQSNWFRIKGKSRKEKIRLLEMMINKFNQIINGVLNQEIGNFENTYVFPEKIFQLFGVCDIN